MKLCLISLLILISETLCVAQSKCILFNFGDSNSDTGGLAAGLGLFIGPPSSGIQYFNRTTGRFCNGRLYVDFISESLNINYLDHYLESSGSDFSHGVNFAVSGSATDPAYNFALSVQTGQFGHYLNRTCELRRQGKGLMISDEEFRNAVYSIDIGQNDITIDLVLTNLTYQQYIYKIPVILERIENSTKALYQLGGRKFWMYNTGPMGCLPQTLSQQKKNDSELDEAGCMVYYNNAAKDLNNGLSTLHEKLRSELKDATVILTDMYTIKYDLFANPTKYGFENPLMACCGYGGPPYNYVTRKTCGQPIATACVDPSRSVIWDGVHYTEAANAVIASQIMSGKYSRPYAKLDSLCRD